MNAAQEAQRAALSHALPFFGALFDDPAIIAWLVNPEIDRRVAAGELVHAESLLAGPKMMVVPEGYGLYPEATVEQLRAELDAFRTAAAEHFAGNDHTAELVDLIENGLDLSPRAPQDPTPVAPDSESSEPDTGSQGHADADNPGRPVGFPMPGEQVQCSNCDAIVPDSTERPREHVDQAMLSYIRWSRVLCLTCHDTWTQEMKR